MDDGPWTALGTLGWFLGVWVVMMAAMMFPSLAPTVALYSRMTRARIAPLLFIAGYLVAWGAVGAAAFAIAWAGGGIAGDVLAWDRAGRWVAGATLLAAAAYELTPLKDICLEKCRSPLGFLLGSWRDGRAGSVQMGIRHGAWCVGCCWALMASLFALGVMSIVWMAFVAAIIAAEKTLPWRRVATYGTAGILLALGLLLLAAPDAVPALTIPGHDPMPHMDADGLVARLPRREVGSDDFQRRCVSHWWTRTPGIRSPVRHVSTTEEMTMPEHKVGTRDEWQAARDELAKLEAQHAELNEEIKSKRVELPWVPVEKEYVFDTEDGKKSLAELFDGRSQLLAYNIMYGPDYSLGACPGCTSLGDEFSGGLIHMNKRDVTFLCFSRAPIDRLAAYKQRMGWQFPYVSTYDTDFPWDFGLAMTEEQANAIPEVKAMVDNPPEWLREWGEQIGAELKDGLREGPGYIAFARENGTVYHTYTVMAPDPFVQPHFNMLLERTPKPGPEEPRSWRKDEYPD